jgi:adenosylcobinamide-GDP ribazoletransferase
MRVVVSEPFRIDDEAMMIPRTREDWTRWIWDRSAELNASLAFSTRLPLARALSVKPPEIAQAAWALPLAGIVIGGIGAVVYAIAVRFGLPAWPAAGLAVAATLGLTGCLHEDGLADTADGLGGGGTRAEKLAIMRDSRSGAYGVCALVLSILIRVSAVASLIEPGLVLAAMIAAHAAARAAMPVLMYFLAPARADGLSFDAGRPSAAISAAAAVLALLVLIGCLGVAAAFLAAFLLALLVGATALVARRQIGGQTGDVLGALEQVGEIVVLLVALG